MIILCPKHTLSPSQATRRSQVRSPGNTQTSRQITRRMPLECIHEFRFFPPFLIGPDSTNQPMICPCHMKDIAKRTKNPPSQALSHPKGTPNFIVAERLVEDTQAAHDEAHQRGHREAARAFPGFFCQTCGFQAGCGCLYHVLKSVNALKKLSNQRKNQAQQ